MSRVPCPILQHGSVLNRPGVSGGLPELTGRFIRPCSARFGRSCNRRDWAAAACQSLWFMPVQPGRQQPGLPSGRRSRTSGGVQITLAKVTAGTGTPLKFGCAWKHASHQRFPGKCIGPAVCAARTAIGCAGRAVHPMATRPQPGCRQARMAWSQAGMNRHRLRSVVRGRMACCGPAVQEVGLRVDTRVVTA
jgi:hypothetical protein